MTAFYPHSPNITARRHNIRLASTKEQRHGHKPKKVGSIYPANALSVTYVHSESIKLSIDLAQPYFALQTIRPQKA